MPALTAVGKGEVAELLKGIWTSQWVSAHTDFLNSQDMDNLGDLSG